MVKEEGQGSPGCKHSNLSDLLSIDEVSSSNSSVLKSEEIKNQGHNAIPDANEQVVMLSFD